MNFDFIHQRFSGRRSPFLNQPMFLQAWADFICAGYQAIKNSGGPEPLPLRIYPAGCIYS